MHQAFQVAPQPLYKREKPERNPAYLRFVKRFPCAGCGRTWTVDPCHTGPHGIGQKSSDKSAIPLCRNCHDRFDEDPRGFAEKHGLDIPAVIERLNRAFDLKIGGRQ